MAALSRQLAKAYPDTNSHKTIVAVPLQERMVEIFKTKTRDEWAKLLEGTDACAAAVVGLFEAPSHPHLAARRTFIEHDGYVQPAPSPRFSRTPSAIQNTPAAEPMDAAELARQWSNTPSLKLA